MRLSILSKVLAITFLGFALTACQTTNMTAPVMGYQSKASSQDKKRGLLISQTEDYRRTIIEGVAVGAILGGLGGAVLTAATGGSEQAVVRNAMLGAALGGLAGGAIGSNVAKKKQQYVQKEDELNAKIKQARSNNAKLSKMVASANSLVRQRQADLAKLDKQNKAQRAALAREIGSDQRAISGAIAATSKEIRQLENLKNRYSNNRPIGTQLNLAQAKRKSLQNQNRKLTSIKEKLR